jgi:hypothetical protein
MAPSRRTVRWQCPSAKRALRSDLSGSAEGAVIARRPPGGGAFYFRLDIASVFESEQQGHNNAFLHGVRLPWSFGVSRARILALSLVAAITLTCGALAQGGGGRSRRWSERRRWGCWGDRGRWHWWGDRRRSRWWGERHARHHRQLKRLEQRSECSAPRQHRPNAINSPGTGVGPGPNPGPFNK